MTGRHGACRSRRASWSTSHRGTGPARDDPALPQRDPHCHASRLRRERAPAKWSSPPTAARTACRERPPRRPATPRSAPRPRAAASRRTTRTPATTARTEQGRPATGSPPVSGAGFRRPGPRRGYRRGRPCPGDTGSSGSNTAHWASFRSWRDATDIVDTRPPVATRVIRHQLRYRGGLTSSLTTRRSHTSHFRNRP
jgi:hypothetical protein